jgi:type VI secretion system secreted protein Hcp
LSRRLLLLAAIPALLAVAGPAHAQTTPATVGVPVRVADPSAFLKLDGIPGESTNANHPGEIDVQSFDFAVTNAAGDGAGGGGGAGKATFAPIKFTKTYDSPSPLLLARVASGQHIPSATFTFSRGGRNGDGFLVYKLSDVTDTSYEQGGDTATSPLLEHVALSFTKVQVSYTPVAGPPLVTAGWDVLQNKPI